MVATRAASCSLKFGLSSVNKLSIKIQGEPSSGNYEETGFEVRWRIKTGLPAIEQVTFVQWHVDNLTLARFSANFTPLQAGCVNPKGVGALILYGGV
jgi:hypothetical protein